MECSAGIINPTAHAWMRGSLPGRQSRQHRTRNDKARDYLTAAAGTRRQRRSERPKGAGEKRRVR